MNGASGKALTFLLVASLSWYSGLKFWQPLVVEQLREDNNLRGDVYVADTSYQPKSWDDLKQKVTTSLHPDDPQAPKKAATEKDVPKEIQ